MIKKICTLLFMIFTFNSCVYAQELILYQENEDFSAEALLNGEFVPLTDMIKYPQTKSRAAAYVSESAYTQLNDTEKGIYDSLLENINLTKDGKSEFTFDTTIEINSGYDISNTTEQDDWKSAVSEYISNELGYNMMRGVYALYSYDHPEYFWIDAKKISLGVSANMTDYDADTGISKISCTLKPTDESYYYDCYTSTSQVNIDIMYCNAAVSSIISKFPENATDYNKVLIINEWLLANNSYNYSTDISKYAYIAPGALIYGQKDDESKHPVCEAYSEAFKIICNKADIPCVCGETFLSDTNTGHKWNLVKLDGKWYYYDATWNDTGNSEKIYDKNKYTAIGISSMQLNDIKGYHDLDTAQLGFSILTPQQTDFLDDKGIASVRILDINSDNYINRVDCAAALKLLVRDNLTADINTDSVYDLTDITDYLKLLFL